MASITLTSLSRFPKGTTVGVYSAVGFSSFPVSGPSGTAVTTFEVTGSSAVVGGLESNERYFAAAKVNGIWENIAFSVSDTQAGLDQQEIEGLIAEKLEEFNTGLDQEQIKILIEELGGEAGLSEEEIEELIAKSGSLSEAQIKAMIEKVADEAGLNQEEVEALIGTLNSGAIETVLAETGVTVVNVKNAKYGAKGNGTTDDAAAINAASLALKEAGGGTLFFPASKSAYLCKSALTYYEGCRWMGGSAGFTGGTLGARIKLSKDLWTSGNEPARFIIPSKEKFEQGRESTFEHLTIEGTASAEIGKSPNRTVGIRSNASQQMFHVHVSGFHQGVASWGNHQRYTECWFGRNYINYNFASAGSGGNQTFVNTSLSSMGLASIHIDGDGFMDNVYVFNCDMGSGPVGILKTDLQSGWKAENNIPEYGTASTTAACTNGEFYGLFCEGVGNGAFIDISTGGVGNFDISLKSTEWRNQGMSWTGVQKTTNYPLSSEKHQAQWAVVARRVEGGSRFVGREAPFQAGSVGTFYASGSTSGGFTLMNPSVTKLLGSEASWIAVTGGNCRVQSDSYKATVWACNGTVEIGDLVTFGSSGIERATKESDLFGVAVTAGVEGGAIAVAPFNPNNVLKVNTAESISKAEKVSQAEATPYKLAKASGNTGMRVLGKAPAAATTSFTNFTFNTNLISSVKPSVKPASEVTAKELCEALETLGLVQ